MSHKHFWPTNAILLGAWEAAAFLTGRRVPTISTVANEAGRRHPRITFLVLTAWSVGLWRHLLLGRFSNG